ncbi:response regulator [Cytobacillus pseudoceanisediminis]|uniref:response regulator n=1 Tax=Cytobacillus pseudoceanisediminis TaxID=3051614 RepID=UPI003C2F4F86
MIRTIIVDDEELSLLVLKKKLSVFPDVKIVRSYTSHENILRDLKTESIDAIFLDIEMKDINGIELAQEILTSYPSTQIVFVSGHTNYAVNAFELDSIDYLLKPVTAKRLEKTIIRLQNRSKSQQGASVNKNKPSLEIYCFGALQVYFNEEPLRFRTAKTKELFAFLTANMGKYVHRDIIIEKLWPEHDYKNAKTYLHTCLSHLRKTFSGLGISNPISFLNQNYCMLLDSVFFDAEEFNKLAKDILNSKALDFKTIESAIEIYKGPFLEINAYEWVYEYSETYQETLLHILTAAFRETKHKDLNKAVYCLKIYQKVDPYSEFAVLNLIQTYAEMGWRSEALRTYQCYKKLLEEEMSLSPAPQIKDFYSKLLS